MPLHVDRIPFERVWQAAGESSLIDVQLDGKETVKAIIQDVQFEPRTNSVLHIDLYQVKMDEKVTVDVSLNFLGEPPAVKELGGTLVKVHDDLEVEGLPGDLVKEITVDVSQLKTFDDSIEVKDLAMPKGLDVKVKPEEVIAYVEAPRSEEELAELESAVEEDVSKVEKVEDEKKEEEEAEEGAEKTEEPAPKEDSSEKKE